MFIHLNYFKTMSKQLTGKIIEYKNGYSEYIIYDTPLIIPEYKAKQVKKRTVNKKGLKTLNSLQNTKTKMKRYILANFELNQVRMITLTFKYNLRNFKLANNYLTVFLKKLSFYYPDLKYISVPERQKRGAMHYHILIDKWISQKTIENLWVNEKTNKTLGFVSINFLKGEACSMYILKYLTKEPCIPTGYRTFKRSANLEYPKEREIKYFEDLRIDILERLSETKVLLWKKMESEIYPHGQYFLTKKI